MITIIAFEIQLPANLQFLANVYMSAMATIFAWLIIGGILYFIVKVAAPVVGHWIPGEIDDILIRILAKPVLWYTFAYGSLNSIGVLNLSLGVTQLSRSIFNTMLVLNIAYLIWKLLHDIVFYYGTQWVKRTQSRIDDTIMPLAKLFGSGVIILVAIGVILTIWDVNIISVFIGAGVLSLVLVIALQDALRNAFASLSLLADAPFAVGDLIMLSDDKVFRVDAVGLRATQLYDLFGYSTVYMPNYRLARNVITNISRPTIEMKTAISVQVQGDCDLSQVRSILESTALGFPAVVGSIPEKIRKMTDLMSDEDDNEAKGKYLKTIEKLRDEHQLNEQCLALVQLLTDMADTASHLEEHGYTSFEIQQLQYQYVQPTDETVGKVVRQAENWAGKSDPYLEGKFSEEVQLVQAKCQFTNSQLKEKWAALQSSVSKHEIGEEMRFDDQARDIGRWIRQEYKSFPEPWKNPDVEVGRLERDAVVMTLKFVVDDIRLEHNERKNRVAADLAIAIHKKLRKEGIKLA